MKEVLLAPFVVLGGCAALIVAAVFVRAAAGLVAAFAKGLREGWKPTPVKHWTDPS